MRKLALKRLKGSDLSFFKSYFVAHPLSKQKGFNLDASVLEDEFFPRLKEQLKPLFKKSVHVDLTLMGPGLAGAYTLARKIKIDSKNLRLNGELIHDPHDQAGRFDALAPGDFVLFEFGGSPLPSSVSAVLIAAALPEDAALHAAMRQYLPRTSDSMCVLSEDHLQGVIDAAAPHATHPVRDWLEPELLEAVASGDAVAIVEVTQRRAGRGMTAADLKHAKATAERTGELGEELLDAYFRSGLATDVERHVWVSQENAISPFDFHAIAQGGLTRHVDAKSTSGKFETPLYLSTAEIRHALSSGVPYDLYRLYGVKDAGAQMRVAKDINDRLLVLNATFDALPDGVRIDALAINPNFFDFDAAVIQIAPFDEADDEDEV